ncbi:MAG: MFS transporter [Candidatus Lokiarchaeota archaeon]|nr:MFS transporter [Candidatus Lokiarchaeota archaeon]
MSETTQKSSHFDRDPVTTKEYIGYNMGALPGAFFGSFMGQIQAFYYKWMGLGYGLIIIAQVLFAVWNVLNDPLFGILQNRTKTRSGRYIPWIKWCAPFFSVAFILVFIPPGEWKGGADELQVPLFIWYLATQALYDTFFTIIYLAHVALLPQMTFAATERTKISVLYAILSVIGGFAAGLLPLLFLTNPDPQKIQLFQILVYLFAGLSLIPWILVVKWVKERPEFLPPGKDVSLLESFKIVFRNPSGRIYIIYDGISVGILNILLTGLTFMFEWLFGLISGVPRVNPNWTFVDALPAVILLVVGAVAGVIVQLQIPKNRDIKTAIQVGLIFQAVGFFIAFLGTLPGPGAPADAYSDPSNIWLFGAGIGIGFFGLVTDFVYHNPMRGDTIDYDELKTGERHESIYAGIGCIFSKPMISVALAIVPAIMTAFGFENKSGDPSLPALGVSDTGTYPMAVIGVAVATLLVPAILATIGAIAWKWYPLDRKALDAMHVELAKVHEQKRAERLTEAGGSKFVE